MRLPDRADKRAEIIATFLLFSVFLLLGIVIHRDYGVSWDEKVQREQGGLVPYEYVMDVWEQKRILPYPTHYPYGPVFSLSAVAVEKLMGLEDVREIYFLRHLLGFLLFFVSTLCFYALCKRIFDDWRFGILGALFLIASPRIFAHAFFNPKDLPLMSLCIIGMFTLIRFLDQPTAVRAVAHGIACALVVDMRIPGLFLPALSGLFLLGEMVRARKSKPELKRWIATSVLSGITFLVGVVMFWPRLWASFTGTLTSSFATMGNYPSKSTVLFLGEHFARSNVPWYYIPVWIGITTPILYLAFFGLGLFVSTKVLLGKSIPAFPSKKHVAFDAASFFFPVCVVLAKGSTLYDGWRHLFFVYPALLLIALVGVRFLFTCASQSPTKYLRRYAPVAIGLVMIASFADTAGFMIRNHPYQNVYFNPVIGGIAGAKGLFDLDYWGTSYRRGLELVLESDPRSKVSIFPANMPGVYNRDILTPEQRERIQFPENPREAEYFMTIFKNLAKEPPLEPAIAIEVDGVKILGVYRTKPVQPLADADQSDQPERESPARHMRKAG